jgi:TPR repeat protein
LALALLALVLVACSADRLYWGSTPQYVRNQLDAADRLMAAGETAEGRALFEQMAETGHPEAMIRAGRAWLDDPDPDRARAQAHLEAAWARNSDRRDNAGLWLARAIEDENPERAITILETVEARGERFAAGDLAALLQQHRPGDPRIESLWRRGAAEGDVTAMLVVAQDYGDVEVAQRAVSELEARWNAGDASAGSRLAALYAADGPLPDPVRERRWLERAAERHDSSAYALGQYLIDQGQREAGERWIMRAAQRGHPGAQAAAARIMFDSSDPDERALGERLARRAAAQGHDGAMLALGRQLTDGKHSPEETAEGLALLRTAADQGNVYAQNEIGGLLLEGNARIPKEPEAGIGYLLRAAENGHSGAMLNYARALLSGNGVARDPAQGAAWLRQAAEADNEWAQLELGRRLLRGDGMSVDSAEARLWLERSAAQGNGPAGRELANL